jgi:AraC family transcriptional regulator
MIDIKDMNYEPNMDDISNYIGNPLFDEFNKYMNEEYKVNGKIEYSKDVWARGWNIKFKKSGKALCVVYPEDQYFTTLVVVGNKEKERVEKLLVQLSEKMQNIYHNTKEGNGQRWLMVDVNANDDVYQDILKLIRIRRESK